jgi:hypothetical protein
MNEDIDSIHRMRAITISREYGSGGGGHCLPPRQAPGMAPD